jgi:hypothetical protein
MSGHTREEHIAMMGNPNKWPHTTILPLVNRKRPRGADGFPVQGFLHQPDMRVSVGPPEPTVYLGNMLHAAEAVLKADAIEQYGSLEEVADDGWEVD